MSPLRPSLAGRQQRMFGALLSVWLCTACLDADQGTVQDASQSPWTDQDDAPPTSKTPDGSPTSGAWDAGPGDAGLADADVPPPDASFDATPPPEPNPDSTVPPPIADECITDVHAGDHTFMCDGLRLHVLVDAACTQGACGLIVDLHGGSMSGLQMRDNTRLHELAPPHGYIVVHPDASGLQWDLAEDPALLTAAVDRLVQAFHIDAARVHLSGLSQGAAAAVGLLCQRPDLIASVAFVGGRPLAQAFASETGACVEFFEAGHLERIPLLFMSGTLDESFPIEQSRESVRGLLARLEIREDDGRLLVDEEGYRRRRWESSAGVRLDYIEHDYGGQPLLDGHCVPGGRDVPGAGHNFWLNAMSCTTGNGQLDWGQTALDWFVAHPRR